MVNHGKRIDGASAFPNRVGREEQPKPAAEAPRQGSFWLARGRAQGSRVGKGEPDTAREGSPIRNCT